jgi:glycosyltransferase involved in cell wall biosynthesis
MKVLSLSTVFPNPSEPLLGAFVRKRLLALSRYADVRVIAPQPVLEYGGPKRRWAAGAGMQNARQDGPLTVYQPRWFYPPLVGWSNPGWLAASLWNDLKRLRATYPFDILDGHFGHPIAGACALLAGHCGVPFTITLRGDETMHAQGAGRRKMMQWGLKKAARVITVSNPLRDFAIELGVDPSRVTVIPNGVDTDIFHPTERTVARQKLGMDPAELHIVSVGYLIERKGHHRIVEALPGLRSAGLPVRLWVIGDPGREGAFADTIRRSMEERGASAWVQFVPAVPPPTLAEYMSAADVLCLPSTREGWPNVVNEALACGTPVVATNVGGVPDMLPSEQYGLVVPVLDGAALEQALGSALTRTWDREAIAQWGGSRNWDWAARQVYEQFSAILSGK